MSADTRMLAFVQVIVAAKTVVEIALSDDEALGLLAARGVKRADLEQLLESAREISNAFYEEPKPV